MKIDDIKKGKEYGLAVKYGDDPRRVEVLGIITVVEQTYNAHLETYQPRNVRVVSIKFQDKSPRPRAEAKGTKTHVMAREIIAPWSELGPKLQKRAAEKQAADDLEAEVTKRVKKLLGRNFEGYITTRRGGCTLDVSDKSLIKLLALAEKGASV